ncbi:MAG: ferredoxin [Candidatus Komeilibacteria bacterium]|nr:ferredoxin [Candidatus Komeilibacteria bacterium]
MAYKAVVNKDVCVSTAACVATAVNTFELDQDGLSSVKKQNGNTDDLILKAAQGCPVNAIPIFDENGKKIYPKE